jgi:hypothetical protein
MLLHERAAVIFTADRQPDHRQIGGTARQSVSEVLTFDDRKLI